jgi:hypothetical protein
VSDPPCGISTWCAVHMTCRLYRNSARWTGALLLQLERELTSRTLRSTDDKAMIARYGSPLVPCSLSILVLGSVY